MTKTFGVRSVFGLTKKFNLSWGYIANNVAQALQPNIAAEIAAVVEQAQKTPSGLDKVRYRGEYIEVLKIDTH